jgi:hypothetical protein
MVDPDFDKLDKKVEDLENRLSRLETKLGSPGYSDPGGFPADPEKSSTSETRSPSSNDDSLESKIGEYGMAWMGNIVLLFGILFLTQYLHKNNRELVSLIFGFSSVAFVYLIGYYTRKSLPYMSRLFNYNGHLLLYIQAMRICLFRSSHIIDSPVLGHAVVFVILISLIYLAYRNNSQLLAVIVWLMAVFTAIASGFTHVMLPVMVVISGSAILFAARKGWWTGLIISIFFVYFTFLIWILGNPILNRSIELIEDHQLGYVYLFACALAYSLMALLPKSDQVPENSLNPSIILNGLGFSLILTLSTLAFFTENYFIYFGLIGIFCIGYSILLKMRGTWKTVTELYAIYSFVALSISIAGIYHFPLAFFLLSLESLLVVSMALWFRSRFIVIMNTILFVGLLIIYIFTADPLNATNFAFAIVALLTARILNWKKQLLEIRTELIRNIFLLSGALMVLFSLHKAVPANFVTLSWTGAAMVFFMLSILIRNKKYRWLAILTMVITVIYLFIVDLSNISLGYRIVALMFIAAISLGISIFYSRRLKSRKEEQQ